MQVYYPSVPSIKPKHTEACGFHHVRELTVAREMVERKRSSPTSDPFHPSQPNQQETYHYMTKRRRSSTRSTSLGKGRTGT